LIGCLSGNWGGLSSEIECRERKTFNYLNSYFYRVNNFLISLELMFALDNVDETATHLQTDDEQGRQIASFDINWLSNNVF